MSVVCALCTKTARSGNKRDRNGIPIAFSQSLQSFHLLYENLNTSTSFSPQIPLSSSLSTNNTASSSSIGNLEKNSHDYFPQAILEEHDLRIKSQSDPSDLSVHSSPIQEIRHGTHVQELLNVIKIDDSNIKNGISIRVSVKSTFQPIPKSFCKMGKRETRRTDH
jgi:hypothetical protein